jgi:hypothetical protein
LLSKYKKDVINQQLQLQRLANACIDVFGMTAVLSRASRSIMREDLSAAHEVHGHTLHMHSPTLLAVVENFDFDFRLRRLIRLIPT